MMIRSRSLKRNIVPELSIKKKLRSELPRRKRTKFSPVLCSSLKFTSPGRIFSVSTCFVDSSSCLNLRGEVSCNSSRVSVRSESKARTNLKKRQVHEIDVSRTVARGNEKVVVSPFLRITRSYYKRKESEVKEERKEVGGKEAEVSESSYVESNTSGCFEVFGNRSLKLKRRGEVTKEIEDHEGSKEFTRSEISCVERISGEACGGILKADTGYVNATSEIKDGVGLTSGAECCSKGKCGSVSSSLPEKSVNIIENRGLEFEFHDIQENYTDENFAVSNSDLTTDLWPKCFGVDSNLACTEQFSYEDVSEYSSSQAFSDLQSEILQEYSDLDFSGSSASDLLDSLSEFSERSVGNLTPSPTFSLLLQYREEFSRSTTQLETGVASRLEEEYNDQITFLSFEKEEDEESYQMFRNRERHQIAVRDYAKEYCSTTDCGDLILRERSQMVQWIIELCSDMELHQETMFLGVSLLDRFLSKGLFKNKRNLQILGIACLTLAIRLEENQPYNSVRRKNFYVGSNAYSRREVVAMEWLVEEVLKFRCFLPTAYNFLWFYLKAARADADVEKKANCMSVLVLSDRVQIRYWPSTIAAALVILATLGSSQESSHQRVLETHVRTKTDDLHECLE